MQAGDGNDTIDASNGIAGFGPLTINGGPGNDTIRGGDGNDTLLGGNGNDTIDGNRGNDVVIGGGGNDTFVWDPGDGSDTVEGQGGTDAMDFNGSNANENIDVSANGTRVRLVRDVAAIAMDLNGIEALNLDTLGGTDTVNVHPLTGTGLTTANVNVAGFDGNPDGSPDNVNVIGTDGPDNATVGGTAGVVKVTGLGETVNVSGGEAGDGVGVDTLGGNDTITNSVLTPGPAAINIDGGADPTRRPTTAPRRPTRSGSRTTARPSRRSRPLVACRTPPMSRTWSSTVRPGMTRSKGRTGSRR